MKAQCTVWAHDASDPDVYLDPEFLTGAKEGDFAELWPRSDPQDEVAPPLPDSDRNANWGSQKQKRRTSLASMQSSSIPQSPQQAKRSRRNFYFRIKKPDGVKSSMPTVSVSSTVLRTLRIRPRSHVSVRLLKSADEVRRITLDVVEIHFKGVYLTRNDHYRVAKRLSHRCVFVGQCIDYLNDAVRLTVSTAFKGGNKKFSGYIGENTRLVFRSDSSRMLIFIQMSSEMWNFDETGDVMFQRLVNSFIPEMLHRWHIQGDSHLVSIILFTSVADGRKGNTSRLKAGILEKKVYNFYRVVVDSVHISRWPAIMQKLRMEFERFPEEVLVDPGTHELRGYFLPSSKANILETFSMATTLLTGKFVDKDLCRTGVQAMIATAGSAFFDVDMSDLYQLSKRLLGVEIGIELVSLARPPLHVTPLFRSLLPANGTYADPEFNEELQIPPDTRLVFCVPTWINMSFWNAPDLSMKQWIPRSKIDDLQMVGLTEQGSRTMKLKHQPFDPNQITNDFMRRFDAGVFKSVKLLESQKEVEMAAQNPQSTILRPKASGIAAASAAPVVTTAAFAQPTLATVSVASPVVNESALTKQITEADSTYTVSQPAKETLGALLSRKVRSMSSKSSFEYSAPPVESELPKVTRHHDAVPYDPSHVKAVNIERSIKAPRLSPSSRKYATSPRSTTRISPYGSGSPDRERAALSNNVIHGYSCDLLRPELQSPSMWRVLPNPALIDRPSRVDAYGRWANVYPPNKKRSAVSWQSLKAPASLPLTSESFPSIKAFREEYKFQFYDLDVDKDEILLPDLLDEMIGLRLQMGFQIATGPSVRAIEASLQRGNPNRVVTIIPRAERECIGIRVYMTRLGLVHRLAVDELSSINVRLYTWSDSNSRRLKCDFNAERQEEVKVKTRHDSSYHDISPKFLGQGIEHLNWSLLDQQVSGADDPLMYPSSANTKNLVGIRYVILPTDSVYVTSHETLSPEESQVEGISRFVRSLLRHREPGSGDPDFMVSFYTGQLAKAITDALVDSGNKLELNRLNKSISHEDLAAEMQGKMGLVFRDRRWHWKHYHQVFTGHDFVVWLEKTFSDINTPEEAEDYGRQLMNEGVIRHPEDRHPFFTGHYFYEISKRFRVSQHGDSDSKLEIQTKEGTQKKSTVNVSENFVINIDPKGVSKRPERVSVSLDRMHNPKNAFHVLVEWLNATPKLVDEMFSGLGRIAAPYGLKLVQVPVADVSGSIEDSPFRSALVSKLAIDLTDHLEMQWFRYYMLRRNGYILDIHDQRGLRREDIHVSFFWGRLKSASPQFIHKSGYVLVQLEDDGRVCITPNTLHLSRVVLGSNAMTKAETECEHIMNTLYELCQNKEKLEQLLVEGRLNRKKMKAYDQPSDHAPSESLEVDPDPEGASSIDSQIPSSVTSSRQSSRHSSRQSSMPPISYDKPTS